MHHSFQEFLRQGGTGEYVLLLRDGQVVGRPAALSLKSTFPKYSAHRAAFSDRLDRAIAENTRMLLTGLTPPDTVPVVREGDLRDVSDAKDATLEEWDARLARIFAEYHTHPQRLRPLRTAMEERLVRAFAGAINQLRQEDLGIDAYIWRSQDDAKVRDLHAGYDDQIFRWDTPPEGGHPGEAYNCRCYAEPILPGSLTEAILAQFDGEGDGSVPPQDLRFHETRGGHTIALHVGKSEAFLLRSVTIPRVRTLFASKYRYRHGSFSSLEAAQKLTNANLSQNAEMVNSVARGDSEDAFVKSTFGSITGKEAYRTTQSASSSIGLRNTIGVGTYIRHAPDMPNGFIIITSYPRVD